MSGDCSGSPQVVDIPLSKRDRIMKLKEKFVQKFGVQPEIYFRVPGRVNLIGEHVDYCGYSVCPMALDQDLLLAVKTAANGQPVLEAVNVQPDEYPDCLVSNEKFMQVEKISQDDYGWCAYLLCGMRGGIERMNKPSVHMKVAVDCNIPPRAGLSSSSALVSGAMLATTYLNKVMLSKLELAKLSAECEHYIGTAGGGMDQAIAFCATEGTAKHIEFNPLRATEIVLPRDAVFVVAHSLVTKEKSQTSEYNSRVVETRLAAKILARDQNLNWRDILRIADVQNALGVSIEKMICLVKNTFHSRPYTKEEVGKILCAEQELKEAFFVSIL